MKKCNVKRSYFALITLYMDILVGQARYVNHIMSGNKSLSEILCILFSVLSKSAIDIVSYWNFWIRCKTKCYDNRNIHTERTS